MDRAYLAVEFDEWMGIKLGSQIELKKLYVYLLHHLSSLYAFRSSSFIITLRTSILSFYPYIPEMYRFFILPYLNKQI